VRNRCPIPIVPVAILPSPLRQQKSEAGIYFKGISSPSKEINEACLIKEKR